MKIIFKPVMGEIRNLLDSLYFLYNKNYKKTMEAFNIKPDKAVEEALEILSEKVNFSISHGDLFFKEEISTALSLVAFEDLESCNTVLDFIKVIRNLSEEEAKYRVLKDLSKDDTIEEDDLRNILKDEKKTIQFIRNLELESAIKWEVFEFFQEAKPSLEKLAVFLESYYPLCKAVLQKNKAFIEEFNAYLIGGIEDNGEDFIRKNTVGSIDFSDVEEICVASAFFNSHSLSFSYKKNMLHIYFGTKFKEVVKGLLGEEQMDINLNILKNISDKTRFQILMLLKDKELYGQEIAEKVGITMATVSYHMSYLMISNMVLIEKVGHKGYYKLNKETLRGNAEFLKEIFQL